MTTLRTRSRFPPETQTASSGDIFSLKLSHLGDARRILRSTADEVKLAEFPHLDGPVGLSSAANRLVEGVTASLAGGSTQPLRETENRVTA